MAPDIYIFPGFPLASDNGAFHLYGKRVFPVGKVNRRGFSTGNFSNKKNLLKYSSFHIFKGMVGKSLLLPFALSHYSHAFSWEIKWNSPFHWKIFKCCDMLNTNPISLKKL